MGRSRDLADGTLSELNVDSNTLAVDATNNRVGIGTASPNLNLNIEGTGFFGMNLGEQANNTPWSGRLFFSSNSTAAGIVGREGGIGFFTGSDIASSVSGTERMRIDSSGRVTMPYQPSFKQAWDSRVYTGASRYLSTNDGDSVSSGRDNYNIGSHFNSATGAFTAPVAGTYMFIFSVMRNGSNGSQLDVRFYKNNGINMWGRVYRSAYNNDYEYATMVTTTNLAANDYVQVRIEGNTSIYNDDTYFAGHLLG